MKLNHKGFGLFEVLLVVVVAALLAGSGFYIWRHNPQAKKPVQNSSNPLTVYRSSHSTLNFAYPSSWKLVQNRLSASYDLEDVSLDGPGNFVINFSLQAKHVNPALSCAVTHFGTTVPVSNEYVIIPTLDSANQNNISYINLMDRSYDSGSHIGCGLGFYLNKVTDNMGFVMRGRYVNGSGNNVSQPAAGYFNLPEVQAAQQIFKSLKI